MTPEEELKILEEFERVDKLSIVVVLFCHEGDNYGHLKSDEMVKSAESLGLIPKTIGEKKFFKVEEVKKLFPEVFIVEFVDFSGEG